MYFRHTKSTAGAQFKLLAAMVAQLPQNWPQCLLEVLAGNREELKTYIQVGTTSVVGNQHTQEPNIPEMSMCIN